MRLHTLRGRTISAFRSCLRLPHICCGRNLRAPSFSTAVHSRGAIKSKMFLPLRLPCTSPGGSWNAFAQKRQHGGVWRSTPSLERIPRATATFSFILTCKPASKLYLRRKPLFGPSSRWKTVSHRPLTPCGERSAPRFHQMPLASDRGRLTLLHCGASLMPTFAAVDIGSNSVRLKIARLAGRRLRQIHEDREVTRLGEGVFRSGFLTPESMAETVKVLRRFHRAAQQVVTDTVRVVATSALRDARNSQAFLEWVRSATGWRVEIISGVEEARLIHLGLVTGPRIDSAPMLMMDLGGGSCELTVSQGGHIRDAVSLPLGAVRLTNEFLRHDPPRKGELKRLRGFVAREVNRVVDRIAASKVKSVIATSGTAAALAAVAGHMRRGTARQRNMVSRAEMTRIAKRLARLPVAERRKIEGIGPRRAEIVVAGSMVYHQLLDHFHLKGFRYSPLGLRDGILAQMAADYDRTTRSGRQIESERWESILKAVD